ncbi:MAG: HupE/UreJ family protein [Betaproteobacteria bacterium]|nr:HupE/UreJ family protein [Betaproteobacteria bacterium]
MFARRMLKPFLVTVFALASSAAFAHAGHSGEPGFLAGFLHPFLGADHLAAMLAVGIWSAMTTRRVWIAPLAFVSLLLAGALLTGFAGFAIPAMEPMIAASLLVIGLLLAMRARLPIAIGSIVIGLFALFHGAAHGAELASAHPAAALSGMAAGTAMIHFAGIWLGFFLNRQRVFYARAVGGAISLFGIGLLAGMA